MHEGVCRPAAADGHPDPGAGHRPGVSLGPLSPGRRDRGHASAPGSLARWRDRPRLPGAAAGPGCAGLRAVWALGGRDLPARHPRPVADGRRHGGAEHRPEITGDHSARPDGDRHRAGDRRAGGYLLGDSPRHRRRLRGAVAGHPWLGDAQLLAGHHGDRVSGNLVALGAAAGADLVRGRSVAESGRVRGSQPDPGHLSVRGHHADDADHDAGGAQTGLHQDRVVQGAAGARGDPAPRRQERADPGGEPDRPAGADPGGRLGDHGEHLQPAGAGAAAGGCAFDQRLPDRVRRQPGVWHRGGAWSISPPT